MFVTPKTLPAFLTASMTSSGLQRTWPSASARTFEWVTRTGFFEASKASSDVRSPQCDTSTAIPTSFIRSMIATPQFDRPPSIRSVAPVPIRLRAL